MGTELLPLSLAPPAASILRANPLKRSASPSLLKPTKAPLPETAPEGDATGSSLRASFQYHLERLSVDQARGVYRHDVLDLTIRYRADRPAGPEEAPEEKTPDALEKLLEHFSPEKTAERIASFVKKGFTRTSFGQEDTPTSRRGFVDFILPFIRQGVDDALSLFQGFEDVVQEPAEKTFSRIHELLEEFAHSDDGAEPPSPEAGTPARDEGRAPVGP